MKYLNFYLLGSFIFFAVVGFAAKETLALAITEKRVVFEGPKRSQVITIINRSDETKTYRLGWRHLTMTQKGLKDIPEDAPLPPEIKPVTDMVKYAPRRVTLGPRETQDIRMLVRMPAGLPDGEYRSHFWIRPEGNTEKFRRQVEEEAEKDGRKFGIAIQMLAGITLPVIVRKGNIDAELFIENFSAQQSPGFVNVNFDLVRQGERSVYGDINYICNPGSEQEYTLRQQKGMAVYAETSLRRFDHRFEKPQDSGNCSTLTIRFSETEGNVRKEKAISIDQTVNVATL
ncbi:MAG: hypothetical protein AAF549_01005 [Pseudomonadota bacterium]